MLSLSQVLMRGTSPKITMESTGLSCYFCGGSLWVCQQVKNSKWYMPKMIIWWAGQISCSIWYSTDRQSRAVAPWLLQQQTLTRLS